MRSQLLGEPKCVIETQKHNFSQSNLCPIFFHFLIHLSVLMRVTFVPETTPAKTLVFGTFRRLLKGPQLILGITIRSLKFRVVAHSLVPADMNL